MNKCLLKVACYAGLIGQYEKAADVYEQVLVDIFVVSLTINSRNLFSREDLLLISICC